MDNYNSINDRNDYVSEITLLRLHPTFDSYWETVKELQSVHVKLFFYENIEEAKKSSERDYNWQIGLAKTALANGWEQPE